MFDLVVRMVLGRCWLAVGGSGFYKGHEETYMNSGAVVRQLQQRQRASTRTSLRSNAPV